MPVSPTFADDEKLAAVLLEAKRKNDFGRGSIDDRLAQVVPLIQALHDSLGKRKEVRTKVRNLIDTLKMVPIYASEPTMGSEPIAWRWIVYRYPEFHKCVEDLREYFPEAT